MKNYRYFIATLMLAIAGAFQASAQVTETPYSRLGYGTLGDNATGIQRHMGGVGYAMQGGRAVNSKNPASYAATDSLTFIWDVGVDVSQVWSKEGDTKGNAFSGGLDYLSGVFRIAKNVGPSYGRTQRWKCPQWQCCAPVYRTYMRSWHPPTDPSQGSMRHRGRVR